MLYNGVLVSPVQQRESIISIYPSLLSLPPTPLGCLSVYILFNFLNNFVYIYLFLAGLGLRCGMLSSRCSGFSSCRAWTLGVRASLVTACRLSSGGSWALEGGLVASRHGSYWTGLNSCPCIGRQILYHLNHRERHYT